MKLLEENIRKNILNIGPGNDFMDMTPQAQPTKAKLNKWNYTKLQSFPFGQQMEMISKMKNQPRKWEKIFVSHVSDKGLISKIDKEFLQLSSKKPN